jgi:hypothetical protein
VYASVAFVSIRFGLLALAAIILTESICDMPASFDSSAWYYPAVPDDRLALRGGNDMAFLQSIRRPRVGIS